MTAPPLDALSATTARVDGRDFIVFGGCNYLGLAQHPRVTDAARSALARFGLSASASRETTGNTAPHHRLETALATFCGHEAALVVPDGYIANLAALQGLAASGIRHALIDERAHASLADAARLAGLSASTYRHADAASAADRLASIPAPAVVLTDSVFAADGGIAPAVDLLAALRPGDRLLLDDCHGFCVLGTAGRGAADHFGLPRERLIVTTTLAKGLGCAGGVVMGSREIVDRCRSQSTAYVCTTPASPILAAAALEALVVLEDEPHLHRALGANIDRAKAALDAAGIRTESGGTPVFAFSVGDAEHMRAIHASAWDAGVWLPLVAYPGGPAPVYFRISVSARHTPEQIDRLATIIAGWTATDPKHIGNEVA